MDQHKFSGIQNSAKKNKHKKAITEMDEQKDASSMSTLDGMQEHKMVPDMGSTDGTGLSEFSEIFHKLMVDNLADLRDQFEDSIKRFDKELSGNIKELGMSEDEDLKTIMVHVEALSSQLNAVSEKQQRESRNIQLVIINSAGKEASLEVETEAAAEPQMPKVGMEVELGSSSPRSQPPASSAEGRSVDVLLAGAESTGPVGSESSHTMALDSVQTDETRAARFRRVNGATVKSLQEEGESIKKFEQKLAQMEEKNMKLITETLASLKTDDSIGSLSGQLGGNFEELGRPEDKQFKSLTTRSQMVITIELGGATPQSSGASPLVTVVDLAAQQQSADVPLVATESRGPVASVITEGILGQESDQIHEVLTKEPNEQVKVAEPEATELENLTLEALRKMRGPELDRVKKIEEQYKRTQELVKRMTAAHFRRASEGGVQSQQQERENIKKLELKLAQMEEKNKKLVITNAGSKEASQEAEVDVEVESSSSIPQSDASAFSASLLDTVANLAAQHHSADVLLVAAESLGPVASVMTEGIMVQESDHIDEVPYEQVQVVEPEVKEQEDVFLEALGLKHMLESEVLKIIEEEFERNEEEMKQMRASRLIRAADSLEEYE